MIGPCIGFVALAAASLFNHIEFVEAKGKVKHYDGKGKSKGGNNLLDSPEFNNATEYLSCITRRYVEWRALDVETELLASYMDYNETTWNHEFTHPMEHLSFESLSDDHRDVWVYMEYDENIYDCYVNHFEDYDWLELEEFGLDTYFGILGYNNASWYGDEPRANDSFDKDWDELTEEELNAVDELCYTRGSWGGYHLAQYNWTNDEPGWDCSNP